MYFKEKYKLSSDLIVNKRLNQNSLNVYGYIKSIFIPLIDFSSRFSEKIKNIKTGKLKGHEDNSFFDDKYYNNKATELLDSWLLSKKNEAYTDNNLIYCFVLLEHLETMPRFFLVKSKDVAKLISEQHKEWLNMPRAEGKTVIDGNLRKFKIDLDDPNGYENNWGLLDL